MKLLSKLLKKYAHVMGAFAVLTICPFAIAQTASTKPLRIIVPYGAGGGTDAIARALGESLKGQLGRDVLVDNRPGAGGLIGLRAMQAAPADGDTLMLRDSGFVVAPMVQKAANYDPIADIVPIAALGRIDMLMMVSKNVPANNVAEFVSWAKAQPNGIKVANPGVNTGGHMAGELFGRLTGTQVTSIAYRGAADAGIALAQGQVQMMVNIVTDFVLGQVQAGNVKLIGIASTQPSAFLPNLPMIKDTIPGFSFEGFYSLVAPAGVPKETREVIEAAVKTAINDPKVQERFKAVNTMPSFTPAEQVSKDILKQQAFYKGVVQELKLEPQ